MKGDQNVRAISIIQSKYDSVVESECIKNKEVLN